MYSLFVTLFRVQALAICFSRTVGVLEFTSLARTTTVTTCGNIGRNIGVSGCDMYSNSLLNTNTHTLLGYHTRHSGVKRTVECATAVVVVYIAVAVTFVVRFSAVTGTFCQSFRIRALAFLAVRELIFILTLPAAVSICIN